MLETLRRARERILGAFGDGGAGVAVPIFDGPLKPNNRLEEAEVLLERAGLEDMCLDAQGQLLLACGAQVLSVNSSGEVSTVLELPAAIQAMALCGDSLALASGGQIEFFGGRWNGKIVGEVEGAGLHGVNALHWSGQGRLLISDGSSRLPYAQWSRDLLTHGRSGRLLEFDPVSAQTRVLARNLAYCHGVCEAGGQAIYAESWAHRLRSVLGTGLPQALDALPGYPARLHAAGDGGYWLSVFAARTQLLEFVLRQDDYREEMLRTVDPRYWIAPALSSGQDFLEPLQGGAVKQMGILKPWAPPRSYGLVLRLDAALQPLYSLHSRAGGRHHGIVTALERGPDLLLLSKGSGRVLRLPLRELAGKECA